MAQKTLLALVQDIMSMMDSHNVANITDTEESEQVADIIAATYEVIVATYNHVHTGAIFQITGLGDVNNPTKMLLPVAVMKLERLQYDVKADAADPIAMTDITYLNPADFISLTNSRNSTDTNTIQTTTEKILIQDDKRPEYWTTFDDEYILFDSHDSDVDTTLQTSKTMCIGNIEPSITIADSTVPELPAHLFPLLFWESAAACFEMLKQSPSLTAERNARKIRMKLRNKNRRNYIGRPTTSDIDFGRSV